jgi:hypothetical protein
MVSMTPCDGAISANGTKIVSASHRSTPQKKRREVPVNKRSNAGSSRANAKPERSARRRANSHAGRVLFQRNTHDGPQSRHRRDRGRDVIVERHHKRPHHSRECRRDDDKIDRERSPLPVACARSAISHKYNANGNKLNVISTERTMNQRCSAMLQPKSCLRVQHCPAANTVNNGGLVE